MTSTLTGSTPTATSTPTNSTPVDNSHDGWSRGDRLISLVGCLLTAAMGSKAMAFTAPAAGDLGFEFYDIVVQQGIQGPIGFGVAMVSIIFGLYGFAQRNWFMGLGGLAGTTAMAAGDSIVTGVGFTI